MEEKQTPDNDSQATQAAESTATAEITPTSAKPATGKVALFAIVVAVVGVVAWLMLQEKDNSLELQMSDEAPVSQFASLPQIVATVNGTEVSREEYEDSYMRAYQNATQLGFDMTASEVLVTLENQALDILVNTELLMQAATEANVVISEETVDSQLNALMTQNGGEEAMTAVLAEAELTLEDVRSDISHQLMIEGYLSGRTEMQEEFVVSETEMQARYDEIVASADSELPPFADVAAQIEAQLVSEHDEEILLEIIDGLRDQADINVFIDQA